MARSRWRPALWWTLFGLTLVALVAMIGVTIGEQVDPTAGTTPGTAVITRCYGRGTNEQCFGDFRAADGSVSLRDTQIFGEDFAKVGQRFTVYYDPGSRSVTALTSGENLSDNLIFVIWLLVLALVQFWFRIIRPRRRRAALTRRADLDDLLARHDSG